MQQRLTAVEDHLLDTVRSEDTLLTEASRHLVEAGGKRFRPMLVLLAAHFGDPAAPGVIPSAVVVELTHLATLYHDDVMDEAPLRRGELSANSRWTNTVAILTGDYLFARASDLLADLGPESVRIQARTFARLVRGQIQETVGPGPDADPLKHYLQVVADKTASLIATSGQFGAMLAGAPPHVVDTVTSACEKIGVAFQLSDDILDIASESDQSGKTPGTDLREGIRTLPVHHVLAGTDPADARLRDLLRADLSDDDALHAEALTLLRAHPAMARARADLAQWAEDARTELRTLPDVPARSAFESLCDYVVSRTG
ncbi:polyprenyl synthetase family protein [Actinomadura craniellae]|uniref:Polyprenyl synthetase family protein n=1 Tax=Actinomadura craniellae TaxID=2231787 RepID=A0A365H8P2_9ACTN|nr:polyprenyl synthetase family protein [Actinomadura craniellae]RAY15475.1 polyprenyl synthetase family protein [Actinomadura craniellae]